MSDVLEKIKNDPFVKFMGIRVDEVSEGFASCSLILTGDMLNFLGVPHGGVYFSLADVAFSAAANYNHPPSFALDISGSFLKPAKVGETLTAKAELVHSTKRTGLYRLEVFQGRELLATFNGTVFRKVIT